MLTLTIPGEPMAQGRPRFARHGKYVRTYDPPKSKSYKATAQQHMARAMTLADLDLFQGPLSCEITATFTCPKSDRRKTPKPARWHEKKPDVDNVAKIVKDAASGIVWLDDSQVARLVVQKVIAPQGEAPGVRMVVESLSQREVPHAAGNHASDQVRDVQEDGRSPRDLQHPREGS